MKKKKDYTRYKKIAIKLISIGLGIGIGVPIIFFFLVYIGFFGPLPTNDAINNIDNIEASIVYDVNGEILGKYYLQDRIEVGLDEISPFLIKALIATEDKRFYSHNGIDARSLARVVVKSLILQKSAGGGSTITIQLAKNLFPREKLKAFYYPINKTKEAIIAYRIEEQYSKEEILELYLNTVSFGEDVYGVESASKRFFNKSARDLDDNQAATLIGMLKATTSYNPVLHPEASKTRRNVVLSQMVVNETISKEESDKLKSMPLTVDYVPGKTKEAAYFLANLRQKLSAFIKDYNSKNENKLNLLTDGIKVYTTVDKQMQIYAEEAMKGHMNYLQGVFDTDAKQTDLWIKNRALLDREIKKVANSRAPAQMQERREMFTYTIDGSKTLSLSPIDSIKHYLQQLQAGFLAVDPKDGSIRTWVGGIDYQFFPYDHVKETSKRQVGSTFKPFVYVTALENDISPCNYFEAEQVAYEVKEGEWKPANDNANYEGKYTMEGALENSVNTVSVRILDEVGIDKAIDLTHELGVNSYIPEVPSIALGTPSISLTEMVSAYSAFVNGGYRISPYAIQRIEDSDGNILYERKTASRKQVISKKSSRLMTHLLQGVVDDGTGKSIRTGYKLTNDIGGKTGTTQNNADGWFMAVTPELVAGTWVGGIYPEVAFSTTRQGQGATMALPIFARFYSKLDKDSKYKKITGAKFSPMNDEWKQELECDPFKEDFKLFEWLFARNKSEKTDNSSNKNNDEGFFKKLFKKKKKKE